MFVTGRHSSYQLLNFVYRDCTALGDMNGDLGFNILDVVTLANCVLADSCWSLGDD